MEIQKKLNRRPRRKLTSTLQRSVFSIRLHKFAFAVGLCNLPQRRFSSDFLRKTFGIPDFYPYICRRNHTRTRMRMAMDTFYDLKPLTHDKKDSSIRYGGPPLRSPRLLTDRRLKKRTDAARDVPGVVVAHSVVNDRQRESPGLGGGDIYIPSTNDSRIDTAANLCIFGRHAANGGGRITFGQGSDVYIGEQGKASTGTLALRAPTASASPEGTARLHARRDKDRQVHVQRACGRDRVQHHLRRAPEAGRGGDGRRVRYPQRAQPRDLQDG